jgi:ADP-ribose pyrophosphatase
VQPSSRRLLPPPKSFSIRPRLRGSGEREREDARTSLASHHYQRMLAPYELLKLAIVDAGGLPVELHDVRRPDGKEIRLRRIAGGESVIVVPITDAGEIVLVRQWRQALGRFTIEAPAGAVEPGEDAAKAAARELSEEAGYTTAALEQVGVMQTAPGLMDTTMHVFVAFGCILIAGAEVDEPCEPVLMPLENVLSGLGTQITVTETIAAILLAAPRIQTATS